MENDIFLFKVEMTCEVVCDFRSVIVKLRLRLKLVSQGINGTELNWYQARYAMPCLFNNLSAIFFSIPRVLHLTISIQN